jgi:hypothetical protein
MKRLVSKKANGGDDRRRKPSPRTSAGLHAMVLRQTANRHDGAIFGRYSSIALGWSQGARRSSDWSAPNKRRNAKHCREKSGGISTFEHGNVL